MVYAMQGRRQNKCKQLVSQRYVHKYDSLYVTGVAKRGTSNFTNLEDHNSVIKKHKALILSLSTTYAMFVLTILTKFHILTNPNSSVLKLTKVHLD